MLKVGTTVRHNKRGTEYKIVGFVFAAEEFVDMQPAYIQLSVDVGVYVFEARGVADQENLVLTIPAIAQSATQDTIEKHSVLVLYRLSETEGNEPYWLRPLYEFTEDRFTVL